jgi:hypothetical protein
MLTIFAGSAILILQSEDCEMTPSIRFKDFEVLREQRSQKELLDGVNRSLYNMSVFTKHNNINLGGERNESP